MLKKILSFFLMVCSSTFNAQWVQQSSGVTQNLYDVHCISENTVIVVGMSGTILKTSDGGLHWNQKTSGTSSDLMKVQFTDDHIGFAVGAQGALVKSTDAGETWTVIPTGGTDNLYGLSAINENTLYISGDNGLLKKTDDGGLSFTAQNTATDLTIKNVQFPTATTGYALSDRLLKTVDGGTTWTPIPDAYGESFFFVNESMGFIMQWGGLMKTTDGGATLTYSGPTGGTIITDVFALSENAVWSIENSNTLCGCSSQCIIRNGLIDSGIDAGMYSSITNCRIGGGVGDGIPFEGIHFANETTGYAVGWFGSIYKNTTGTMLGTDDIDKNDDVSIYPNPASDQITVAFGGLPTGDFSVRISNVLGKQVYGSSYGAERQAKIDVTTLPEGVYFLTVSIGQKKQTEKVIIN